MSQRFKASQNVHGSKNTRLDIAGEFSKYRFGRDQLAHVSRYLFIAEWIIKEAKRLGYPLRVLDVGCGDIYVARVLVASFRAKKSDVVSRYMGFDIDDKSLAKTRKSLPASMNIELACGDITDNGLSHFEDKSFDVVICTEVIEHIQPELVEGLLREIKRLANRAIISTPNFAGGTGSIPQDHVKEWNYVELVALMQRCGLEVKRHIGVFCNLNRVKALCKSNDRLRHLYEFLEPRMDSDFLSICLARFVGTEAQNIMYLCNC